MDARIVAQQLDERIGARMQIRMAQVESVMEKAGDALIHETERP